MVLLQLGLLAVAFLVLVKSASIAIKKLVKISRHFGLPEFTISFLVVGIVAIFPELAIGINAAIAGNPSLGLGIVFGSNIADLTLIIGIVVLSSRTVRLHEFALKQMTLLVFATILPFAFLLDGEISRADGAMLLLAFAFYVYRMLKIHKNSEDKTVIKEKANVLQEIFLLLVVLVVLFFFAHIINDALKELSILLSAPIFFIGILAAVGTCLPELSIALSASRQKHAELGLGDILGNVFADCTLTLGIISLISPIRPQTNSLALLSGSLMVFSLIFVVLLFNRKKHVSKKFGAVLVLMYAIFLALQFLFEEIATKA